MHTIIGSSGRDHVLIILFQLYGPKAGLFKSNLFSVGQCDSLPHQKNCWYYLIDADVISLFVARKGKKKIQKIDKNQRSKSSYLLRDLMKFNEIFWKNVTYAIKTD